MHGVIFTEFKKFANTALGPDAWKALVADAGVRPVTYLATETYPDQELNSLVEAAVDYSGLPADHLLEKFGEFIVPDLVKVFGAFVKREWDALDLLEHTETVIHKAVRLADPKATPPQLRIRRTSPQQVTIEYASPRRLCAVAKGIISGVAAYYGEALVINETTCMHAGAAMCTLVATRA